MWGGCAAEVFSRCGCGHGSDERVVWQVRTLEDDADEAFSIAISADGTRIVSGSLNSSVKIWDVETGAEVSSFVGVR